MACNFQTQFVMNLKHIPFLFIGGLFYLSAGAQGGYQDGYIVLSGGDTVRGKVGYPEGAANPAKIDFIDSRTGNRSAYGPDGIAGFGAGGDQYRSYRVRLRPYSQDPAVVTSPDWKGEPYDTTVFLRLVTGGRLTLYCYQDGQGEPYFWLQGVGKTPEQLEIRNRVVRQGAENVVITDRLYQYQLADRVGACSLVAGRPVRVAYEENALRKLIETYNSCGKEVAAAGRRRLSVHPELLGGGRQVMVQTSGSTELKNTTWPDYYGPAGGLGVLVTQTRGKKRFAVLIDGLFAPMSLNSNTFHENYYQRFSARLVFDEVKANVQVRYRLRMGNWWPFIGLGVSNSFLFNNTSSQKLIDVGNNQTFRQPLFNTAGSTLERYRPGGFAVAGIGWKRWSLEVRYEKTADLSGLAGFSVPTSGAYALLGFQL